MDIKKFYSNFDILRNLTFKNLKSRYASTFLGIFWAVLTPLLVMLAISFAFIKVLNVSFKDFHIYVLSGILPWFFFSNSLFESTQSIIANANMLRQFTFPRIYFPISCVATNFIEHLIGIGFILPIFALYNPHAIVYFLLLIPILFFMFLFVTGIGILVSVINIYFRDLEHFLGVGIMFWFWITPIFYSSEMVPERYRIILWFNPLTYFVSLYRDVLFSGKISSNFIWCGALFVSMLFFLFGIFVFSKTQANIVKKL
jgi:ABC-2 type transport system permease protein